MTVAAPTVFPVPRSHLADGRVVRFHPPATAVGVRFAVDAEIAAQPVPQALATRFGIDDAQHFWPQWTAAEVACKLCDVPMIVWLRRYGLDPVAYRDLTITTVRCSDLVISVGSTPEPPQSDVTTRSLSVTANG